MGEKELVERLTGRRICEKCGESFHLVFVPPKKEGVCDKCGGKLYQRPDDSQDVVMRRLEIFNGQNKVLLAHYSKDKKLKTISADRAVEAIQTDLLRVLK